MARILVVDDSATAVQFVRVAVRADGHVVEGLDSFIRLASIVVNEPPDLVLLDLSIAAMSGATVASVVNKYAAKRIPILIYSSRSEAELKAAASEMKASGYVRKGPSMNELRQAVSAALRASEGAA